MRGMRLAAWSRWLPLLGTGTALASDLSIAGSERPACVRPPTMSHSFPRASAAFLVSLAVACSPAQREPPSRAESLPSGSPASALRVSGVVCAGDGVPELSLGERARTTLKDRCSNPIVAAVVTLHSADGVVREAPTGPDGRFDEISVPMTGSDDDWIEVSAEGYAGVAMHGIGAVGSWLAPGEHFLVARLPAQPLCPARRGQRR